MKKFEIYLLTHLLKSFFLIFFIFIGISWLLQASRLLNLVTLHKIAIEKVFLLSINIIPNIITNIVPFIILFGLLLTCIKLYKDKEIVAAYTLGISVRNIIKPIIIYSLSVFSISLVLSFIISPYYYDNFKKNEFNLRNNLDIENIGLNSFYNFGNEIVINFDKKNDEFINLMIFQTKPSQSITLANKAKMNLEDNKLNLELFDGFKTDIKEKSNETLQYEKYNLSLDLKKNEVYNNLDINTFGLKKLFFEKNKQNLLIINQRLVDSLLLISIIFFLTQNILLRLQFNLFNIFLIAIIGIFIIFLDNILGNLSSKNIFIIFLMYLNILIPIITLKNLRIYKK
tara:strand:- start:1453 stop:2478 length:1026 start_codon:yes stop_codon:yes gene_type:complete